MLGKTHVAAGVAVSLLILHPTTIPGILSSVAGGAIGGWICDIDVRDNASYTLRELIRIGILAGGSLVLDYLFGDGVCEYFIKNWNEVSMILVLAFLALCVFGILTPHRSFTHSIPGFILFSGLIYYICRPLAYPFALGFISHIVLDLMNKKGIALLYPIRKGFCLNLCSADGVVNTFLGNAAIIVSLLATTLLLATGPSADIIFRAVSEAFARLLH